MEPALCHALAETLGPKPQPAINVVMAYEDISDGHRAMRTYNGLVGVLGGDCEFNHELWKFDALQVSELRMAAALQAREADMIMIATHSRTLPCSLKSWVEAWVQTRSDRPGALVALMAGSAEHLAASVPAFTYLREAAMRARMEFFSHLEEPVDAPSEAGLSREQMRARAETTSSVLEQILNRSRPSPRWGINE